MQMDSDVFLGILSHLCTVNHFHYELAIFIFLRINDGLALFEADEFNHCLFAKSYVSSRGPDWL